MESKEVLKKVLAVVDEQALVAMLLEELALPAIKEFVAETSNPYDDKLLAVLEPKLKEELPKLVAKLVAKLEA